MSGEFSVYGVYVPTLLALMLLAFFAQSGISFLLLKLGVYRHVWHPPLFNLALYVLMLGTVFFLMQMICT
jgi:hypothetical protein